MKSSAPFCDAIFAQDFVECFREPYQWMRELWYREPCKKTVKIQRVNRLVKVETYEHECMVLCTPPCALSVVFRSANQSLKPQMWVGLAYPSKVFHKDNDTLWIGDADAK